VPVRIEVTVQQQKKAWVPLYSSPDVSVLKDKVGKLKCIKVLLWTKLKDMCEIRSKF